MSEAPPTHVTSAVAQPKTEGPVPKNPRGAEYQWIKFVGVGQSIEDVLEVVALAGMSAPKVTKGWVKWAEVPRWGRVGITVIEGYDPRVMEVPILFDAITGFAEEHEDVETNIRKLEWMAGRGHPHAGLPTGARDASGESPLVKVFAVGIHGDESPLVPINEVNSGSPEEGGVHWLVTDIAFYDEPQTAGRLGPWATTRKRDGHRIRQAATVTLLEHTTYAFDAATKRRAEERGKLKHKFIEVRSTSARNTMRKVAYHEFQIKHTPVYKRAKGMGEVVQANNESGRKLGHDQNKPLTPGTRVRIPESAFSKKTS
jgi:hypothetical protein